MTPQEIYSHRFCLGHPAPAGDLRQALARQLEGPVPELFELAPWQQVMDVRSRKTWTSDAERKAAHAAVIPKEWAFWNPLLRFTQNPERPFVARLMLDQPNAAPTGGDPGQFPVFSWSFWQGLMRNMLSPHGDWLVFAILDHMLYRFYLNADLNIGPNSKMGNRKSPPDENLARELHEVLSTGNGVLNQSAEGGDMREMALLLTGLRTTGFDPAYQEPGDRTVLGKTIKFRPDQSMIEEYLRWLAVHPKTAMKQVDKIVRPLLGTNLSLDPAFHERLADVWIRSGGDRRAMLTAMVLDDAAWKPQRGAPVNRLCGIAMHYNINRFQYEPLGKMPFSYWFNIIGYRYENAPDPFGLPTDDRVIGGSLMALSTLWKGTEAQRAASLHYTRIIV
jgi:uncharacterized protein (DUF1800 family)